MKIRRASQEIGFFCAAALLLAYLPALAFGEENMRNLAELKWKNRIILIRQSGNPEKLIATLKQAAVEIDDRDIIWFVLEGKRITSNYLFELSDELLSDIQSRLKSANEDILLIGKDGGVKARYNRLDLNAIFREIDAMPMRIREMRV